MAKFGKKSIEKKKQCHQDLQSILDEAIKIYDFSVLCGHRSEQKQTQLYLEGKSKVTFPNSKHNEEPSLAVDCVPYPIDWKDIKRFFFLAGIIKAIAFSKQIKIRWGGDWDSDTDFNDQNFNDLPHFELVEQKGKNMDFIKKIFSDKSAKYSFSRVLTFLIIICYLIFAGFIAFSTKTMPDIPSGVVWLVSALYGINKVSSVGILEKKQVKYVKHFKKL